MPNFRLKQLVSEPAEKVFASVADVTTGATWPPTVRAASREDVGPIGVGSRFRLSTRGMGDQFVEVAAFEPPSLIVLRSETSSLILDHKYRIESGETNSAAVAHEVRVQFKGFGIAAAPVLLVFLWVGLRLEARALARYFNRGGVAP